MDDGDIGGLKAGGFVLAAVLSTVAAFSVYCALPFPDDPSAPPLAQITAKRLDDLQKRVDEATKAYQALELRLEVLEAAVAHRTSPSAGGKRRRPSP